MIGATGTVCGNRDRSRHQTALSGRGFDRRQKANDAPASEGGEDPYMFSAAGVAAE
jgi:hypothetical protein